MEARGTKPNCSSLAVGDDGAECSRRAAGTMESMNGRSLSIVAAVCLCFTQSEAAALRGKLVESGDRPPAIETAAHKRVALDGDPQTLAVLGDARLVEADLELLGQFKTPALFVVGPFYTSKSMFVLKDGKKYTISYWCPVCSIRSYTPGRCVCCQEETHLDLEEVH